MSNLQQFSQDTKFEDWERGFRILFEVVCWDKKNPNPFGYGNKNIDNLISFINSKVIVRRLRMYINGFEHYRQESGNDSIDIDKLIENFEEDIKKLQNKGACANYRAGRANNSMSW